MAGFVAPIVQGLHILRQKQEQKEQEVKQTLVNILVNKFVEHTLAGQIPPIR